MRGAPGLGTPLFSRGTWLSQEKAPHVREETWGYRGALFGARRSHVGGRAGIAAERGVGGGQGRSWGCCPGNVGEVEEVEQVELRCVTRRDVAVIADEAVLDDRRR